MTKRILSIDPGIDMVGLASVNLTDIYNPSIYSFSFGGTKKSLASLCYSANEFVKEFRLHITSADVILIERQMKGKLKFIEIMLFTLLCTMKPVLLMHPMKVKKTLGIPNSGHRVNKKLAVEAAAKICPLFSTTNKERTHDMADAYLQAIAYAVHNKFIDEIPVLKSTLVWEAKREKKPKEKPVIVEKKPVETLAAHVTVLIDKSEWGLDEVEFDHGEVKNV
jgi:hypothetical protein